MFMGLVIVYAIYSAIKCLETLSPGDYVGFLPLRQEADSKPQACLARALPSLSLPHLMHIFFPWNI